MPTVTAPEPLRARVESIDVLRGIVMILMALDHVRDFFGIAADLTNPARASAALFFTRWITHLCAPTFFLLVGTGAFLSRGRRSTRALSRFLLTRGIWLIVLELTVLRCFGYQFNVDYRLTFLIILWALGWSMVTLAGLVHLPVAAITVFGVATIALHNLLDPVRAASFGAFAPLWTILHVQNMVVNTPRFAVFVAYPLVPWIAVSAAGYGFGQVFTWEPDRRRRFLLQLGIGLTLGFIVLRFVNVYGNPVRWSTQASAMRTMLSFLNTTKYPPSLLYLMMTIGPASLILWMLEGGTPTFLKPALTFGKVPLFYFMLHLPLIHLVAVAVCAARYGAAHWMFESARLDQYPYTRPPGWGYSLPVVYAIWIGIVLALYPLCVWFAGVKQRRRDWWLGYL
ncbi:MAG: DUF1624 domain-containing protein [Acidobacteria bacterium]|nr:DUF1624 domain-containing protein [Acidobacteriota bacterium]